nr:PREDICTED: zinc finger protein 24-like [Phalacrocorax carbo]
MGRDMGTPSKHQRLCSKHFEDSSFEIDPLKIRKYRRLLKEAVPKKFILGEDGNWLVGTPRSFCGRINNKIRKRIRNPEHSRVPGTFDNAAARKGKDLEDRRKGLYKKATVPFPKAIPRLQKCCTSWTSRILRKGRFQAAAVLRSHPSRGVTQRLPKIQNRVDRSRGDPETRLAKFQSQEPSYICTECGNSFGRYADLVRHQQAHTGQRPYKCTECEKSFMEKPRLTNHLRTHNIYM